MIEVRGALPDDAEALGADLRPGDQMECAAYGMDGSTVLKAMMRSATHGPWVGTVDGVPAAMWGAYAPSMLGYRASLWLLTGNAVAGNEKVFMERSRQAVLQLQLIYAELNAPVALSYRAAVRWLEWLGFADTGHRFAVNDVVFGWWRRGTRNGH